MNKFIQSLRNRFWYFYAKRKSFKTEQEFYNFLFTKHPSWNSSKPNEDELVRWREIENQMNQIKTGGKQIEIIEIGCGRGWLSNMLGDYGSVYAIDPIINVIKHAKKLFPHIHFEVANLEAVVSKQPERSFDLAVCTEVIEHVTDKFGFLSQMNKILRAGGTIIITTPRMEHYEDFKEAFGVSPEQPIEEWLTEDQLTELFKHTGFQVLDKKFFSPLPLQGRNIFITQMWVCRKVH
jgi:2-polyprenyl-3-methyl-5-hydroxy-6-metoxy-1,4-benzoquinol methylase